jgi:hypothetical protein
MVLKAVPIYASGQSDDFGLALKTGTGVERSLHLAPKSVMQDLAAVRCIAESLPATLLKSGP